MTAELIVCLVLWMIEGGWLCSRNRLHSFPYALGSSEQARQAQALTLHINILLDYCCSHTLKGFCAECIEIVFTVNTSLTVSQLGYFKSPLHESDWVLITVNWVNVGIIWFHCEQMNQTWCIKEPVLCVLILYTKENCFNFLTHILTQWDLPLNRKSDPLCTKTMKFYFCNHMQINKNGNILDLLHFPVHFDPQYQRDANAGKASETLVTSNCRSLTMHTAFNNLITHSVLVVITPYH